MRLRSFVSIFVVFLCAVSVLAATQTRPSSQVQISPPLVRHTEAPSPDATAEELEHRGDQLRGDKAFLDALDYLRAAWAKNPKSASLLNKIGIVQLQMVHYAEARKS